ncbi:MAG: hypothetical protein AB1Z23_02375 [Eubacteriales bacterium]
MHDRDFLERTLYEDEYVIWEGKPDPKKFLRINDIGGIAFFIISIWILAFIIISSIYPKLFQTPIQLGKSITVPFYLVFFIIYSVILAKLSKRINERKKARYAFTNMRIIVYFGAEYRRNGKKNKAEHYDEDSLLLKDPLLILSRNIIEFKDIKAAKNLYGGTDIVFKSSTSLGDVSFENVADAELLKDIFIELLEKKECQRHEVKRGEIHLL